MHPLRVIADHRTISIIGLPGIVIGDRNRKRRIQSWQGSRVRQNASNSDRGRSEISKTGTSSAHDFPIRRPRNAVAPEGLPASKGCSVDAKQR